MIIYNLAAICRIPGFPDIDYFQTNIPGAEQVTLFAEKIGCSRIVFTSSITVYGTIEAERDEDAYPQPDSLPFLQRAHKNIP